MIKVTTDLDKSMTFETVEEAENFNADVMESLKIWDDYRKALNSCFNWFIQYSKKYPTSEYMMNMTKSLIRASGRNDVDKCYEELMNEGAGE
jgi:hypothetical protein